MDETDSVYAKTMEFEPLLATSGDQNMRSINLNPFHCGAQTI